MSLTFSVLWKSMLILTVFCNIQCILSKLWGVPNVTVPKLAYSSILTYTVTLECSIISTPRHVNVYWEKVSNGTLTIVRSFSSGVYGATVTDPSLTIESLTWEDSGHYTCCAVNLVGNGCSEPTTLTVLGSAPYSNADPETYNVSYGTNVTLTWNFTSVPAPGFVFWERVWSATYWIAFSKLGMFTSGEPSLHLYNVSYDEEGEYFCHVINDIGFGKSGAITVTVYGDQKLPTIMIERDKYIVAYKNSITIDCSILRSDQTPVLEIYWTLNHDGIVRRIPYAHGVESHKISGSSLETPSLTIFNLTLSESGTYNVHARHKYGTSHSRPINVTVLGGVPIVFVRDASYSIGFGKKVTMSCCIESNLPVTNVYWEKAFNGTKTLINSWTVGIQGVSVDVPSLTIMKTSSSDIGIYSCIATNDIGTGYSKTISLDVIGELPHVSVLHDLPPVQYGERVNLFCSVRAIPPPTAVYWEKRSDGSTNTITNGTAGTEGITFADPSLILIHTTDSDSGLYRCFAVNEFGMSYSSPIELTVTGGPPEVSVPSIPHITGTGYTITLSCSLKHAFPAVTKVYWERYISGSKTIISSNSIGINGVTVDNPSLIIPSAMASMSGEYTCLAVNSVGTGRSFPAQLIVKEGVQADTNSDDSNDEEDHTETALNGIIGALSALAGLGSLVVAYWAYKHSRKRAFTPPAQSPSKKVTPIVGKKTERKGSKTLTTSI